MENSKIYEVTFTKTILLSAKDVNDAINTGIKLMSDKLRLGEDTVKYNFPSPSVKLIG